MEKISGHSSRRARIETQYVKPSMRVVDMQLTQFICISGQWGLID
ncbi:MULTISPECIES: hypothetical protein [unclassified Prevotella]|nr:MULTISPECIES: hypothetical protein [unclassified Prevotella]SEW25642.1 hypothetical protein SAMN04487827_2378 [Prevotella sp. khp7]